MEDEPKTSEEEEAKARRRMRCARHAISATAEMMVLGAVLTPTQEIENKILTLAGDAAYWTIQGGADPFEIYGSAYIMLSSTGLVPVRTPEDLQKMRYLAVTAGATMPTNGSLLTHVKKYFGLPE